MSFSLGSAVVSQFQNSFEICPIFFSGGIAANLPGGLLPITKYTQPTTRFKPLPGNRLASCESADYPAANQAIAANALITKPLNVSMLMIAPAVETGDMLAKLTVFTSLKAAIDQHTAIGGLYVVCTSAYIFNNAISMDLTDVTADGMGQYQVLWQWDFKCPLISQQQAQQVQNNAMAKITAGVQSDGSLSGTSTTVGSSIGGAAPAAVPGASGPVGGTTQGASAPFQLALVPNTNGSVA